MSRPDPESGADDPSRVALSEYLLALDEGVDSSEAYQRALANSTVSKTELDQQIRELEQVDGLIDDLRERYIAPTPAVSEEDDAASKRWNALQDRSGATEHLELRDELGRGGMGVVFEAWDEDLRRPVALKRLGSDGDSSSGRSHRLRSRFLAEAQITGQLEHPGIVPVHQIGVAEDGSPFFTMRRVRGRELSEIMRRVRQGEDPAWTRTRVVSLLLKVCETVGYAHAKGVLHRDLKPSNIMVGRYGEVYVMDWGLARSSASSSERPESKHQTLMVETVREESSSERQGSSSWTMAGLVLGTPAYMSPEQALADGDVDPRSDVYSVGAMLYELLTGFAPYEDLGRRPTRQVVDDLRSRPPTSVQSLASNASAELVAITEKAMARRRDDRYSDMMAMADDLRAYLENRVVSAHRTGAVTELRKWFGRNRLAAAFLAGGALIAIALLSLLVWVQWDARVAAEAQNQRLSDAQVETEAARAQAVAEQRLLQHVLDWMTELFRSPNPTRAQGQEVTARSLVDRAMEGLDALAETPAIRLRLLIAGGDLYSALGHREKARNAFEGAASLALELQGDQSFQYLYARCALAEEISVTAHYEEAEAILAEVEDLVFSSPESTPKLQMLFLGNRAAIHLRKREYAAAEKGYREVLAIEQQSPGEGDLRRFVLLHNLAVLATDQGQIDRGESMFREVIDEVTRRESDRHPVALSSQAGLGRALQKQGRHDEAIDVWQDTLDKRLLVLGEDHPETVRVSLDLSVAIASNRSLEEGATRLEAALQRAREIFDPRQRELVIFTTSLARMFDHLGRRDDGIALLAEELERLGDLHTHSDPALVPVLTEQGHLLRQKRDFERSEATYQRALRIERDAKTSDGRQLVEILLEMAELHRDQEELGKAELRLDEAYEFATEELDDLQLQVLCAIERADLHVVRGEGSDAELLYEEALEAAEDLSENDNLRIRAHRQFAELLRDWDMPEEALDVLNELGNALQLGGSEARRARELHQKLLEKT